MYITPPSGRPIRPFLIEVITRSAKILPLPGGRDHRIIYHAIHINDPGMGRRFWFRGPEPQDINPGSVQTLYRDGASMNIGIFDLIEDLFEILPVDYPGRR